MSKSNRDQRRRPASGKKCPEAASGGCVYCRTGEYTRSDARSRRQAGKRLVRAELKAL